MSMQNAISIPKPMSPPHIPIFSVIFFTNHMPKNQKASQTLKMK